MRIRKGALPALVAGSTLFALVSCSASDSQDLTPTSDTTRTTSSAPPAQGPAAKPSSTASGISCTSNYAKGAYSIDIIMQNNTGQTLSLVADRTGRGDGHWAAQPPSNLAPGACAVINAYSDDPVGNLWVTATYQLPDLTFIPFACQIAGSITDLPCNPSALTTMPDTGFHGQYSGTVSDAWQIETLDPRGTDNTHYILVAAPQSTK